MTLYERLSHCKNAKLLINIDRVRKYKLILGIWIERHRAYLKDEQEQDVSIAGIRIYYYTQNV